MKTARFFNYLMKPSLAELAILASLMGLCLLFLPLTLQESDFKTPFLILGFVFFGFLARMLLISSRIIKPLQLLKQRLQHLPVEKILQSELIMESRKKIKNDIDEMESLFHSYTRQLQIEHREALVAKNNLAVLNKNLEIELEFRKSQLENQMAKSFNDRKLAALGEMAGGIAHEINNPLAIIVGRTAQLRKSLSKQAIDTQTFEPTLQSIDKAILRIQDAILDLETISSNPKDEPMRIVPLDRIFKRIRDLSIKRYAHLGIHIDFPERFKGHIEAREVEFMQSLLYLIDNAAEAALKTLKPWIKVELHNPSPEQLHLKIIDSGPGIDVGIRHKIFQPFFTTKDVGAGRGVGLSLSRSILEQHGIQLYFDYSARETTICIDIPLLKEDVTSDAA